MQETVGPSDRFTCAQDSRPRYCTRLDLGLVRMICTHDLAKDVAKLKSQFWDQKRDLKLISVT